MAAKIFEWYGYRADDRSPIAATSARDHHCPFLDSACTKDGGVCSIKPTESDVPVIICPIRMYFRKHAFLSEIAGRALGAFDPYLDDHGRPALFPGSMVRAEAALLGRVCVGVFGQGWDSEVRLPPSMEGGASYSVDFTLIAMSPEGELLAILPVEVQSIDTTGSYRTGIAALQLGRELIQTSAGLNWENVSKRILPQLIVKGLMLQGERLSTHGIYFVTPDPVFQKIAMRLGGMSRLREIPPQPGSITFIRYGYGGTEIDGLPGELQVSASTTISTSDMSIAFISPQNLPPAGSYETRILARLNRG